MKPDAGGTATLVFGSWSMSAKIVDLDVRQLPPGLERLHGYDRAWILLRWEEEPIGRVVLSVTNGTVSSDALQNEILDRLGVEVARRACLEEINGRSHADLAGTPERVTIAVCTRDRPSLLRRCLDSLAALPDDGQEVLVVDNAPGTEETRELLAEEYPWVRYVCEMRRGLNAARNRALADARHPIVAFVDDDAAVERNWLRAISADFSNPLTMGVTGLVLPAELETDAQEVFETHFGFSRRGFRRRSFSLTTHNPLLAGVVGAGANMALRRDVAKYVGQFDEALDAGTLSQSGGDHEMFARILLAGFRITYDPRAVVWHIHRSEWAELERTVKGYGTGAYAWFTRMLLVEREPGTFRLALGWFRHEQLPNLIGALRGRAASPPLSLVLEEFKGCLLGPVMYLRSRHRIRVGQRIA